LKLTPTLTRQLPGSKPIYHAQVVLYQAYLELHENPAVFTAVNADTMEIYTELVPFDAALAQRMSDRALKVSRSSRGPGGGVDEANCRCLEAVVPCGATAHCTVAH
jgi:hypothetical protein